ncbi:MAG: ABC transporter permease [Dehalococcoidia bacterium]
MKGTSRGMAGFAFSRALVLLLVLIIGSYLMIAVMNLGGELDRIVEARVRHEIALEVARHPEFQNLSPDERQALADELVELELKRQGFDRPLVIRNFRHWWWAVSLDLGTVVTVIGERVEIRTILADRSGPTFLLFGTAIVLVLFISFLVARIASRRPGSLLDRLVLRLAPISALPAWLFGIFLILIFASALHDTPLALPWGGMTPPGTQQGLTPGYVLIVFRHMILPVSAILLGSIFAATYSWRTFFVGHSSDEHVEPAVSSESPGRAVDRSSFLRPTPPGIIKHFLVLAASVLMASIVVEILFNWPGLGRLLYQSVMMGDTAVMIGVLVIYGYVLAFLAGMAFLLDYCDVWESLRRGRVAAQGGE